MFRTPGHLREDLLPSLVRVEKNAQGTDLYDTYLISATAIAPQTWNTGFAVIQNMVFQNAVSLRSFRYQNYMLDNAGGGYLGTMPSLVTFGPFGNHLLLDRVPSSWTITSGTPEIALSMFYGIQNQGPLERVYDRGQVNLAAGRPYSIEYRIFLGLTGVSSVVSWFELSFYK